MHAALQSDTATIAPLASPAHILRPVAVPAGATLHRLAPAVPMTRSVPRQFVIQGVTVEGKPFRPSDWAERLAGAMSSFRPGGHRGGISAAIGYSPYCVPHVVEGVKSVIVSEALRNIEPMAWDFVMNFARDNVLVVKELPAGSKLS